MKTAGNIYAHHFALLRSSIGVTACIQIGPGQWIRMSEPSPCQFDSYSKHGKFPTRRIGDLLYPATVQDASLRWLVLSPGTSTISGSTRTRVYGLG